MKTDPMLQGCPPGSSMSRRNPRGFALVIVMFLLALILILVIAFAANMRTERKAAHNMAQGQRADLLAEGALAHAVSLLANNIPDPGNPTMATPGATATNWLINPGRLTLIDASVPPTVTHIPLYSGVAPSTNPLVAVNLNAASPTSGNYPITGANDPMWVSWIPVLQDASAQASQSNQIVGRYAFWIDDECAKINFNTARGKPADITSKVALPTGWATPGSRDLHTVLTPTFLIGSTSYALGHPASVNLDVLGLTSTAIGTLDTDVAADGFFLQPQAITSYAAADPDAAAAFYEQNKFQLTPFSRSPEFNVFGKSRLFMGFSAANLATGTMYQHTSHREQPMTFWGGYAGVGTNTSADPRKMRELREPVVAAIAKYLDRNDWPGLSNKAFRWTGGSAGQEESDQIALNIASMGYWATTETQSTSFNGPYMQTLALSRWGGVKDAFEVGSSAPNGHFWKGPLSGQPMLPPHPGPQTTEVAVTLIREAAGATGNWRLSFNVAAEFYLPPGFHSKDGSSGPGFYNTSSNHDAELKVFTPYFSIDVAGTPSRNNNVLYADLGAPTNSRSGFKPKLPDFLPRDDYIVRVLATHYVSSGTTRLPARVPDSPAQKAVFSGSARVTVKLRLGVGGINSTQLTQMMPVYVSTAEELVPNGQRAPGGDSDSVLEFVFDIPAAMPLTGDEFVQSLELSDPRLWSKKSHWKPFNGGSGDTDSLGFLNSNAEPGSPHEYGPSESAQLAMWNLSTNDGLSRSTGASNFRASSIGMFSFISTGMRRDEAWDTLRFYNYGPSGNELPDWVVLDLLAPSFSSSKKTPISLRNSTAGKINLNTKIYPVSDYFVPPQRTAPLDALFQNMPNGMQAANAIRSHQANGGYFDYIGRICELPGIADTASGPTEYEKETLMRHLASLMTTQSNTFSVWGVAQAVKKIPGNDDYGVFEGGDLVTSERRFRAVVERQVWKGKEGVPGNGNTVSGVYNRTATGTNPADPGAPPPSTWAGKTWAEIDGPHQPVPPASIGAVPHSDTPLETANNPLAAAMEYRIIFWEYLE